MATLDDKANTYLRTLRSVIGAQRQLAGVTLPRAPAEGGRGGGGVDRATSLELRQILRNTGEILGTLQPSAADERSFL